MASRSFACRGRCSMRRSARSANWAPSSAWANAWAGTSPSTTCGGTSTRCSWQSAPKARAAWAAPAKSWPRPPWSFWKSSPTARRRRWGATSSSWAAATRRWMPAAAPCGWAPSPCACSTAAPAARCPASWRKWKRRKPRASRSISSSPRCAWSARRGSSPSPASAWNWGRRMRAGAPARCRSPVRSSRCRPPASLRPSGRAWTWHR